MKIVVMLAVYNGEKFLKVQLDSICNQTLSENILLYIGDDGSNDSTLSIIEEYKNKMNILERPAKNHLGVANNFWDLLLTAPEADYYAFCDQDDIWDTSKLEVAVNKINVNEPILYFSNLRVIDKNSQIVKDRFYEKEPKLTITSQMTDREGAGCTYVFNSKAMEIIRQIKLTSIPMHDTVVILSMLAVGRVIYDSEPRISYRHHENNVMARFKKNRIGKIRSSYDIWIKNRGSSSLLAKELLENYENFLDSDAKKWLFYLANSKKISYRLKLLKDKQTIANNYRGLRSFKIRLLLGLI